MAIPLRKKSNVLVLRRRRGLDDDELGVIGTWKIAYADFVTAMMAFFMLLWLVNITTPEQRAGIADYFNPITVSDSNSGANGLLAGQSVAKDGALTTNAASAWETIPTARVPMLSPPGDATEKRGEGGTAFNAKLAQPQTAEAAAAAQAAAREKVLQEGQAAVDGAIARQLEAAKAEERAFADVEDQVKRAMLSAVELRDLAQNVNFEVTADGLRIQITDQPNVSMFASGSADMNPQARQILEAVGVALRDVPNRVAISGHTDSRPFAANARYTNWELSSDRAQAARRQLTAAGVAVTRVARVEGVADTQPVVTDDPFDARNRRISVTVLRRVPLPGATPTANTVSQ